MRTITRLYHRPEDATRTVQELKAQGIDEGDINSIFQIFASSKGSRGTGLGLPVSQKIVREHGGKIVVTSRPGHGATFVIEEVNKLLAGSVFPILSDTPL